jgi:hypothetical protein
MAFSAPLPPARPLLFGETPYSPADLAPELATTTREALARVVDDLSLLAGCELPPALLELAQEINGTAAQLAQLAERFTTEAAAA